MYARLKWSNILTAISCTCTLSMTDNSFHLICYRLYGRSTPKQHTACELNGCEAEFTLYTTLRNTSQKALCYLTCLYGNTCPFYACGSLTHGLATKSSSSAKSGKTCTAQSVCPVSATIARFLLKPEVSPRHVLSINPLLKNFKHQDISLMSRH